MNDSNRTGERLPVTIAIGMLCKDSIHLVSDSQTTHGNVKSMTANKVSTIKMADAEVLIAQAGHVDHASKALQALERVATGKQLTDFQTFAAFMQDALLEVRIEIRRQRFNCSAEDLQDYFWKAEADCELIAAHYFNGVPYIYQASLSNGVAAKVAGGNGSAYYTAAGTGADLAFYLLEEFARPDMSFNSCLATLIYTVGEIKKHDTYCAGQTRFGWIGNDNNGGLLRQEIVDDIASKIEKYNDHAREGRNKQITEMLESVASEWANRYKQKIKSE